MKAIRTFLILILTAAAAALLLPVFLGGATGGSALSQEINVQADALSSSNSPVTVPEPAGEASSAMQQMFAATEVFFGAFAEICMGILIAFWSSASGAARCIFGFLLLLNLVFSMVGLKSAFSRVNGRRIYME